MSLVFGVCFRMSSSTRSSDSVRATASATLRQVSLIQTTPLILRCATSVPHRRLCQVDSVTKPQALAALSARSSALHALEAHYLMACRELSPFFRFCSHPQAASVVFERLSADPQPSAEEPTTRSARSAAAPRPVYCSTLIRCRRSRCPQTDQITMAVFSCPRCPNSHSTAVQHPPPKKRRPSSY